MIKHHNPKQLWWKEFIWLTHPMLQSTKGNQSRDLRQEQKQRPWRNSTYFQTCSVSFLDTSGAQGRPAQVCGPTHNGLGLYKAAVIIGQPFGSISSIVVPSSQIDLACVSWKNKQPEQPFTLYIIITMNVLLFTLYIIYYVCMCMYTYIYIHTHIYIYICRYILYF